METDAAPAEFQPLPTTREERGRQIARLGGIRRLGARYVVPSQSASPSVPTYLVDVVEQTCTCADHAERGTLGVRCKHQEAVLFWLAQCILFMTTNLAGDVDDAIASRCIVKIGYDVPDSRDQRRIWRTLADLNRIDLPDDTIAAFVSAHPRVSGRDVKNLLKLASFVSARDGRSVDLQMLEFALEYKPTAAV